MLNQAAIGIHNWSVHVQAQYAADRGLISVATMDRRFAKTRAQGPDDIQRYREALQAQQPVGDACDTRPNANPVVARKIAACQQRIAAQQPVLRTAAVAMGDWNMHLKDMARHADGKVPGAVAQQIWVRTYRAAPKHIDPYERAAAQLDAAPTCT
ncbi:hypothetical protein FHX74_001968 [Friedmanniella endophytica]|uniref:Uncharacterized protein n=1 Tax=Microlunatus kandeliicorticis TaxID=1759536 RepID=A0A7W3ISB1_9ACTN|nr:hypothetical protein [Microlunatus kandeliicorticis]MBA8794349.1 hypothetical protein [Microlunatus kandeliicorticis]